MRKFLTLSIVKPLSNMVIIKPAESVLIQVNLLAENIDACFVNIKHDTNHLKLIEGARSESLGHGSFSKQFSWVLEGIKNFHKSLWIEITAEAGELIQVVGFNIKIKKTRNHDYEFKN